MMGMEETTGLERVYRFIVDFITENTYAPFINEIRDGAGLSSKSSVHENLMKKIIEYLETHQDLLNLGLLLLFKTGLRIGELTSLNKKTSTKSRYMSQKRRRFIRTKTVRHITT